MILVILSIAALLFFFVCVVNYHYQRVKYKYSTDEEMKRLRLFELPSTWRVFILISALILAGTVVICGNYVMGGFSTMGRQENIINQYQNDSSYQNTDSGQTD